MEGHPNRVRSSRVLPAVRGHWSSRVCPIGKPRGWIDHAASALSHLPAGVSDRVGADRFRRFPVTGNSAMPALYDPACSPSIPKETFMRHQNQFALGPKEDDDDDDDRIIHDVDTEVHTD